jgi:hypothetical protein
MDPYNITERRGRYRGSLWVSNLGLRWLLDVFVKLRNPNQNTEGFFEFQRDGNKMLEISCHANRGGRFVEVSEYHSGNQQGCIRVPEGRRGAGWSVFEFQSRKYFLCETRHTPATQAFPRQTHDTGMTAGGTRNTNQDPRRQKRKPRKSRSTKSSGISGSSRDSRALGQSIAPITPTDVWRKKCLDSNLKSWVLMNPEAPRPTRKTRFNWNPSAKTIRVTKNEGEPRKAQWASLKFKALGLAPPNVGPQAQPERIKTSDPVPMDSDLHTSRVNASNEEAEASRLSDFQRESSDEAPGRSLGDSELSSVPPVNFEVTVRVEEPRAITDLALARVDLMEEIQDTTKTGSETKSHNGMKSRLDHDTGVPLVEVLPITSMVDAFEEPGCAEVLMPEPSFVTDLALVQVDLAAELPVIEAESEHHSQTVMSQCEAEPSASLTCEPLAVVAPPNVLVAPRKPHSLDRSTWVNTQYKGICELMGFPLESHEQQCLALLRRIEAARFIKKGEVGLRKMVVSGTKGARELRNLVSSVNYEGRQRVSC